jgi:hypothetical protein
VCQTFRGPAKFGTRIVTSLLLRRAAAARRMGPYLHSIRPVPRAQPTGARWRLAPPSANRSDALALVTADRFKCHRSRIASYRE